jgi:low affinity Fe/Cu permease
MGIGLVACVGPSAVPFATSPHTFTAVSSSDAETISMNKRPIEAQVRTTDHHFARFAAAISTWLGSKWAFLAAFLVVVAWVATGPVFHFSNDWAQLIGTGTSIATFLYMVFLIQNTQNRDARAINLELDELIGAMDSARNQMIDIERLTDLELDEMHATYEKVKTASMKRRPPASDDLLEK